MRQPSDGGGEKTQRKSTITTPSFVQSQDQKVGLGVTVACDTEDQLNLPQLLVNTRVPFRKRSIAALACEQWTGLRAQIGSFVCLGLIGTSEVLVTKVQLKRTQRFGH